MTEVKKARLRRYISCMSYHTLIVSRATAVGQNANLDSPPRSSILTLLGGFPIRPNLSRLWRVGQVFFLKRNRIWPLVIVMSYPLDDVMKAFPSMSSAR